MRRSQSEPPYQEEGSTFSHQGNLYDLNVLFEITHGRKAAMIPVSKLEWITKYGTPDEKRVDDADTSVAIIALLSNGVYYVLDGFHRLTKAIRQRKVSLPVIVVLERDLKKALITNTGKHTTMNPFAQPSEIDTLSIKHKLIVAEAFSLTDNIAAVKGKLGVMGKTLSDFVRDRVTPQSAISLINYSVALRDLPKVKYTDLMNTNINCPRGLKVMMPDYVAGLVPMLEFAEGVQKHVLEPFSVWLSLRIAAPESLKDNTTVQELKRFKDVDIEPFRAALGDMVDPTARVETMILGNQYPNLNSIQGTWKDANALIARYLDTRPAKVIKLVDEIATKVMRLVDIIEKDAESPDTRSLSGSTATTLSSLVYRLAVAIDFYGILGTQLTELSVACNYQAEKIKAGVKAAIKANGVIKTESFVNDTEGGIMLRGQWFSESDLRYLGKTDRQDVAVSEMAWVFDHIPQHGDNTEEAPADYWADAFVTAIRWNGQLYPVMNLELLSMAHQAGQPFVLTHIIEPDDLFPTGAA